MKTTIKKAVASTAAVAMIFGMSVSAYAEDRTEDYTREEIIDLYWTKYYEDDLPGERNPKASLKYHILEQFLDEQYGHTEYEDDDKYMVYDWSNGYNIGEAWEEYEENYTKYWHYETDDETGDFYIEEWDPEQEKSGDILYTFDFADGKWNMIDVNGSIVDSFDPHGGDGSHEEAKNKDHTSDIDDFIKSMNDDDSDYASDSTLESETEHRTNNRTNEADQAGTRVTGDTAGGQTAPDKAAVPSEATGEKAVTAQTDNKKTDDKDSDSSLPFVIGGIVIVVAAAAGGYAVASKKRKGDGK